MALVRTSPCPPPVLDIRARAQELARVDTEVAVDRSSINAQAREASVTPPNSGTPPAAAASGFVISSIDSLDITPYSEELSHQFPRRQLTTEKPGNNPQQRDISFEQRHESRSNPRSKMQICYLLISPLLPPISGLATTFRRLEFSFRDLPATDRGSGWTELAQNPSCAIYGDSDAFTSSKKLDRWAQERVQTNLAGFRYFRIPKAGHFWHGESCQRQLKNCVRNWIRAIGHSSSSG